MVAFWQTHWRHTQKGAAYQPLSEHCGDKHTVLPPAQLHPLQHLLPTPVPITQNMPCVTWSFMIILPNYTEQGSPVNSHLYMQPLQTCKTMRDQEKSKTTASLLKEVTLQRQSSSNRLLLATPLTNSKTNETSKNIFHKNREISILTMKKRQQG